VKLTAIQLKQIIAEEIKKQKTLNEYGLGATMSSESIQAVKTALDMARTEIEAQLAEEGYEETELEDFAAAALTELFKEYMDEIGYGGRIDMSGL
jgi:hypothetical protein